MVFAMAIGRGDLYHFLKVVEIGNISQCAKELGYSQAGISAVVKRLEQECGFALLYRSKDGVKLTPEGETMLPIFHDIEDCEEHFKQAAADIRGMNLGTIRIGSYESIAFHWLPSLMHNFNKHYPNIEFELMIGNIGAENIGDIEEWINDMRIDIGFISTRKRQHCKVFPLINDEIYVVLPKRHPLAHYEKIPLIALGYYPLILTTDVDNSIVIETYENLYGPIPHHTLIPSASNIILPLIENQLGISILPGLLIKDHHREIIVKEIDPPFFRELVIAVHPRKKLRPLASKFFNFVMSQKHNLKTFLAD